MMRPILFLCLLSSAAIYFSDGLAVMSVDLGSEFVKIAIVKPGVPMEIVLNKESKRKTPVAFSFRENERAFGENAITQIGKQPTSGYQLILDLIGKTPENPIAVQFQKRFPWYTIKAHPETGTVVFQHDESTQYTPEELIAMVLERARELAEDAAEQSIEGAVITVPPFWNQAERRALLQAAELAGIKVLQLMNSNTAAALQYGIFRRKDFNSTPTHLLFYDMGSSSTVATVVSYGLVKPGDPQLTVRGVGFDRTLGGVEFQIRLQHHLARLFLEQKKLDATKNPRAMLKLFKEAGRVKQVLSANADHFAQVEGLMNDVDFRAKVTREEFETMCADLFGRIAKPIEDALRSAEITLDEISQVILVGGGTRVPKVQEVLMSAVKMSELGRSLNADEAPALGASYMAADQSKGYRVKKFIVQEGNMFPIAIDFERDDGRPVRRVLFGRNNPYPQKKVLTFHKMVADFSFQANYGDLSFLSADDLKVFGSQNISQVDLEGVAAALAKHTDGNKGIKAHFRMDGSGVLYLDTVDAVFEKEEESTLQKLTNTISNFFTGNSDNETTTLPPPGEEKEAGSEAPKTADEQKAPDNSTAAQNQTEPAAPKKTLVKESIANKVAFKDLKTASADTLKTVRDRLVALTKRDELLRAKDAAKNALEAFIYDTQHKLDEKDFVSCSIEEEREAVRAKLSLASDWLWEGGEDAETKEYQDKLNELKAATRDIYFRVKQKTDRPKKLAELKEVLNLTSVFLKDTHNLTGKDLPFTEVERQTLEKAVNETKLWIAKMIAEQAKVSDQDSPKLLVSDIDDKILSLKREVGYLVTKWKSWRPKPKPEDAKPKKTKEETADKAKGAKIEDAEGAETGEEAKGDEGKPETPESIFDDMVKDKQDEEEKKEGKADEEEEVLQLGTGDDDGHTEL